MKSFKEFIDEAFFRSDYDIHNQELLDKHIKHAVSVPKDLTTSSVFHIGPGDPAHSLGGGSYLTHTEDGTTRIFYFGKNKYNFDKKPVEIASVTHDYDTNNNKHTHSIDRVAGSDMHTGISDDHLHHFVKSHFDSKVRPVISMNLKKIGDMPPPRASSMD